MGVKSYVAGIKAEAQANALDTGMNIIGGVASLAKYDKALDQAKDKADITRETTGIEGGLNEFLENLQYDRDYGKYQEKIDEHFADVEMQINENELLSDEAKRKIIDEYIPVYKEQTYGNAAILKSRGKMAEIEVEVEGYGSALASDDSLDYTQSKQGYKDHLLDLGVFNDATVQKMVDEYGYSIAPIKGMQVVQQAYIDNYADDSFNVTGSIDQVATELGLDASQKNEMKKMFSSWQNTYDQGMDALFTSQLNEINAGISQAYDEGALFDVSILDDYMPQLPARHRINLYKSKNTAYANNDKLLEENILRTTDESVLPDKAEWEQLELIHDPAKRDELGTKLLVSYGESLSGKSLYEVRKAIQDADVPVSKKVKNKALAEIIKNQLDREGDVKKVAQDILSSAVSTDTTTETPVITDTIRSEAPPIDQAQLEESGTDYINNYEKEVEDAIRPMISLGFGAPLETGKTLDEVVQETAEAIVEEKVEEIVHPKAEEPVQEAVQLPKATKEAATETVAEQIEEIPEAEEPVKAEEPVQEDTTEAWWYQQYLTNSQERQQLREAEKASKQAELDRQDALARREAGMTSTEEVEEPSPRPPLLPGMPQEDLVINMLQIIKDGDGKYITSDELELIKDEDVRGKMTDMASIKDSLVVDSPLALSFIDSMRRDPNVVPENLKQVVEEFVRNGYIKAETAEKKGLTEQYSFAHNENWGKLLTYIGDISSGVFPSKSGEAYNSKRARLETQMIDTVIDAITMNPELLDKDYQKLQLQLENFAYNDTAKRIIKDLEKTAKFTSETDIPKRIDNLERSDVSTFQQDIKEGNYDAVLNYEVIQRPEIRSLRNGDKTIVQDALTKELTPYKDYQDLVDNGTDFERLMVMANTSFLLTGGALENALYGSFGIKAADMVLIENQWAFKDPTPNTDGLYFVATDTDVENRGTLGWGMVRVDSDGVNHMIMFKDYVDPQKVYRRDELKEYIDSPSFKNSLQKSPDYEEKSKAFAVLGMGGIGPTPAQVEEFSQDKPVAFPHLDEYEALDKEINTNIKDIMAIRSILMGYPSQTIRKTL